MYDPDIMAAMTGQLDHDTAADRVALRAAVQHQITDNETGTVLDVRTAVLVSVTPPGGRRVMEVIDGPRWDTIADTWTAIAAEKNIALEVSDGRQLFAGDQR